jgi:hypothetical protein
MTNYEALSISGITLSFVVISHDAECIILDIIMLSVIMMYAIKMSVVFPLLISPKNDHQLYISYFRGWKVGWHLLFVEFF